VNDFVVHVRARANGRSFRGLHDTIKDFRHDERIAVPNVVKNLRTFRNNVRRITASRDDVVDARILRNVLTHQISHEVHRFDAIECTTLTWRCDPKLLRELLDKVNTSYAMPAAESARHAARLP
jgi:hypothetical protein